VGQLHVDLPCLFAACNENSFAKSKEFGFGTYALSVTQTVSTEVIPHATTARTTVLTGGIHQRIGGNHRLAVRFVATPNA
jgi:hypothetical protein